MPPHLGKLHRPKEQSGEGTIVRNMHPLEMSNLQVSGQRCEGENVQVDIQYNKTASK